ncbi:hypothetical protein C6A87_018305 [Mycobacterium sp. ITM-2016-00317]|nr:hypothetical protein [Mycobacterium sp. ITM-2016-00317]WNG85869.1 hypothetical protein C6A87_018305 [Mycobacterium sp. ITM-2016-00317]
MERIFWVNCPTCDCRYPVDSSLRHRTDVQLECPSCRGKFVVTAAAAISE